MSWELGEVARVVVAVQLQVPWSGGEVGSMHTAAFALFQPVARHEDFQSLLLRRLRNTTPVPYHCDTRKLRRSKIHRDFCSMGPVAYHSTVDFPEPLCPTGKGAERNRKGPGIADRVATHSPPCPSRNYPRCSWAHSPPLTGGLIPDQLTTLRRVLLLRSSPVI
jgi:hypothetical protein